MTLSIVILSYNTKDLITECIHSLEKEYKEELESSKFEIIVVDNNSTDGSTEALELLKKKQKNLHVIKNKENEGFSRGCNIGAEHAKGEYLFFLNSDTLIQNSGLHKMVKYLDSHQEVGILGGKLVNNDGSTQRSVGNFFSLINTVRMLVLGERHGGIRFRPAHTQSVQWVSGASLMISKSLFDELNGFDKNIFMYLEDVDLCFRVKKLGYATYFFSEVSILHVGHGSSNREFAIVQIYKGILYYFKKHHSIFEYGIIKTILIMKGYLLIFLGVITSNSYLTSTYRKALAAI